MGLCGMQTHESQIEGYDLGSYFTVPTLSSSARSHPEGTQAQSEHSP